MNLKNLAELINELKKRGEMYIQPFNYFTVINYILGFDHYHMLEGNKSYFYAFQEWLHLKIGYHCSKYWVMLIYELFSKKNDEKALDNFYNLYSDFIIDCKDIGIDAIIKKEDDLKL